MKQYITFKQYTMQEDRIKDLKKQGVEFIYKKSKTKIILGCVCVAIAIIPNGLGLIFYPLGFSLLASGGIDFYTLVQSKKQRIKFLLWSITK